MCGLIRLEHLHPSSKFLLQRSHHRTPGLQSKVNFTRLIAPHRRLRITASHLLLGLSSVPFVFRVGLSSWYGFVTLVIFLTANFVMGPLPSTPARVLKFSTPKISIGHRKNGGKLITSPGPAHGEGVQKLNGRNVR